MKSWAALSTAFLVFAALGAPPARATERRFTYTNESTVLAAGGRELEPWTTWRGGRHDYYSAFDERLEFEVGVTDRLQSSWYLNLSSVTTGPSRQQTSSFDGISSEWKVKFSDAVADRVGSALYLEATFGPDLAELEGKLIFDRQIGKLLVALNLVGAYALDLGVNPTAAETEVEAVAALSYALRPGLGFGLEMIEHNRLAGLAWEEAVFFGGPVATYAAEAWWATLTVALQWVALVGASDGHQNLLSAERAQVRFLFGWHL